MYGCIGATRHLSRTQSIPNIKADKLSRGQEPAHHGQRHDGPDVPLDDRQLRHHLLQVRRGVATPVVNVPHDAARHRLAGEVLHLEIQLHDLRGGIPIPGQGERRGTQ